MASLLPAAEWTRRDDLARLVATLDADNIRWVGGAVRDTLLGSPVEDIDAATILIPDEVIARLEAAGITTVPTGIDHGTITAVLPSGHVEITTLRKDVSTDGRRATIAFASDWRDDAARRDFTINALYAHPETRVISDFFGGMEDLSDRRIRFIGDARERIREDHLRILRYYRFQARFGADLDREAEEACAELADTLTKLSRERIAKELLSLLALPNPLATVVRMRECGVLPVVLPETGKHEVEVLAALIRTEEGQRVSPDPLRRLAALLPALPPVAETVAARLRLSREQRERLFCVAARLPQDQYASRALAYRNGRDCAVDRVLLAGGSLSKLAGWDIPELPLKGGEIVAKGVEAGPEIARIMKAVEDRWINEQFPDRSRVMAMLEEELAGRRAPNG
ncbi:CCA tRNA nucleotidyltransferase [Pontixanthobacter aestiaquae]|uniref:CCA tRNA nucleotidyltransferase n=1 Tax=Pontixanthobacter aestiaquae TaxID=1509367 RepID=A0A844Z7K9_9SPHN|nr:CCA tRNA nucleotidyltransferase [Pontixanthobacter aestiaquae]MDN3645940.1 CCA tRNA nucleotidyltransferase [Pontixanthobacter aestiaquae]MXO83067.1 CCA tRNA nucleotidyltransferase [Pontixanthobacter aestiaquae]